MNFKEASTNLNTQVKKLEQILNKNYTKDLTTELKLLMTKGDTLSLSVGTVDNKFSVQVWEEESKIQSKASMKKIQTTLAQYSSFIDEISRVISRSGELSCAELRNQMIKEHERIKELKG